MDAVYETDGFSWRGDRRVMEPGDQGDCNSCWAYVTAQVMTDRFRIALDDLSFPLLSPMTLMREVQRADGGGCCEPKTIHDAVTHAQVKGVEFWCCAPYTSEVFTTCGSNTQYVARAGACGAGAGLAQLPITPLLGASERGKACDLAPWGGGQRRAFLEQDGDEHRARRLVGLVEMQREIRTGPVLAVMTLYPDFLAEVRNPAPFAQTGGVYLRAPALRMPGRTSVGFYDVPSDPGDAGVGHVVAVIGWGKATLDLGGGHRARVAFWVVRNSWGTAYDDAGYHRIGWSSRLWEYDVGTAAAINETVGVDTLYHATSDAPAACAVDGGCGGMYTIGRPSLEGFGRVDDAGSEAMTLKLAQARNHEHELARTRALLAEQLAEQRALASDVEELEDELEARAAEARAPPGPIARLGDEALTRLRDALRDRPRDATVDASEMAEDAEARADVESKGGDAPLAPGEMAPSADESGVGSAARLRLLLSVVCGAAIVLCVMVLWRPPPSAQRAPAPWPAVAWQQGAAPPPDR